MINEVVSVDAGPAIGELDALAGAAEGAAAKIDAAFKSIKVPSVGAAGGLGFGKLADQAEAAAAKIEASFARIGQAAKGIGDVGTGGAAGLGKLADAENAAAEAGARLAKSSATVADTFKGVGDQTKRNSAWLDEYNATMAESAKVQRDFAKVSADTSAKVATSQRLQTSVARDNAAEAVAAHKSQARAAEQSAAAAEASSHRWKMAGLAGLAVVAYGVDQASKLQAGITRLQTTAGESQKNLPMISAGILKLAPETATSQAQLLQGAYMAESAGFHGKNALNVLKAGAEGAFAEGAPLGDTINALTSMMNAYGMKGAKAPVSAMDQIIAMVSRGKMTMAGAVSALPTVLPVAAQAGLGFGQVGGALATMTAMGTSPDLAAQHLAHTIGSLQNMSGVQVKEIQQLGGDPVKLQHNLGKTGLLGTLTDINKLVTGSMGSSGLVMQKTFNQSASAAADANKMISAMPPAIKGVAQAYADGKISAKAWNKEVFSGSESAQQKNLLQQFATVENQAKGFSNLLKSGSPAAQTYEAALSKALGGQTGLQTFLSLMGIHQPATAANTRAVTQAGKHPAADVTGWPEVQKTLKFQLGSAEQALQSVATEMGKAFLPLATTGLKGLGDIAKFFSGHETLTKDLGILAGGGLGLKLGKQLASGLSSQIGSIGKALKIPGLSNLGKGTGLDSAAAGLGEAGAGLRGAASALTEAAGKLAGAPGAPGGKPREEPGAPGRPGENDKARPGGEAPHETPPGERPSRIGTGATGILASLLFVDPILQQTKSGPHGQNWFDNPFGMPGPTNPKSKNNWLTSFSPYERLFETGGAPKPPPSIPAGTTPAFAARFGGGAPAKPKAPGQWTSVTGPNASAPAYYPSGQPFYGEVPHGVARPLPATPTAPGKLAALSQPSTATPLQIKIPAPDLSALNTVKSKIEQSMSAGGLKPFKIPAPDTSALDSAKGKAQAAGTAITSAITGALGKPVHAKSPDLSAYRSAAGAARADGAAVSQGLAAGILAGEGAAVAAAHQVASAVAGAMAGALQTRSPSKVTQKIGADTAKGLEVGLQGGQDAINAAASAIGRSAAKAADIASIDSTVKKLLTEVPKGDTALTAMLKADNRDLDRMAAQRAKLEAEITNSQQLAQSTISGASVMNVLNAVNPAGAEPIASSAIITGQQYQAASLKQFAQALRKDKSLGLNATELSQIAQAGPDQGLGIAQGIASGGKSAVAQLNALQKQMQGSAAKIGDIGGVAMYQAGKDMGAGLAEGLKAALAKDDKDMAKLAAQMVADVEKTAKTAKSKAKAAAAGTSAGSTAAGASAASGAAASKVTAPASGKTLASAAAGLSQAGASLSGAATALNSAAAALNKAAGGGPGTPKVPVSHPAVPHPAAAPSGGGYGGTGATGYLPTSGGGGGTHFHQHVHIAVQGSVMTENDLMDTVQNGLVTRSVNNWRSGLVAPGRTA